MKPALNKTVLQIEGAKRDSWWFPTLTDGGCQVSNTKGGVGA